MEAIKQKLEQLMKLSNDRTKVNQSKKKLEGNEKELVILKQEIDLNLLASPLRKIAEQKYEEEKEKLKTMQEEYRNEQEELERTFETRKKQLVQEIEKQLERYNRGEAER